MLCAVDNARSRFSILSVPSAVGTRTHTSCGKTPKCTHTIYAAHFAMISFAGVIRQRCFLILLKNQRKIFFGQCFKRGVAKHSSFHLPRLHKVRTGFTVIVDARHTLLFDDFQLVDLI